MTVSLSTRGTTFAKYVTALALAKGRVSDAEIIAETRFGGTVAAIAKAASIATMDDGPAGGAFTDAAKDFLVAVTDRSVLGRLRSVQSFPLQTRLLLPTSDGTAHWTREGEMLRASDVTFEQLQFEPRRIAAMAVATEEMLNQPQGEEPVRRALVRAVARAQDEAFLDPAAAGDDLVPTAITYGAATVAATGAGNGLADLKALAAAFAGNLDTAFLVMRPQTAVSLYSDALPNIGARGGEAMGIPVITGAHVPAGMVALIDAEGIAFADGGLQVRVARHALIDLANAEGEEPIPYSLWQNNAAAIMASRIINWRIIRDGAVAYLTGVA